MSVHTKYFTTIHGLLPAPFTLRRGLCFSFLTLVMSGLIFTPATGQIPNYRLQEIPLYQGPSGNVQANQMNNLGMVVGFHTVDGVQTGYVYDHYGVIDTEPAVHSLTDLIVKHSLTDLFPVLSGSTSSCVGINNLGQVVGYYTNETSQRIGYFLDLVVPLDGTTQPSGDLLPQTSGSSYGKLINDNQDVLIYSQDTSLGYLYNLALGPVRPLTDASGAPFTFTTATKVDLNYWGQVVGNTLENFAFRLTPGGLLEFPPLDKGSTNSINDAGQMAGTLPATGSGKRATPKRACRYDIDGQIKELSSVESFSHDINNNGDVAGRVGGSNAIYHNDRDRWYPLDDLVVGSAADVDLWNQTTGKRAINLADRDATGFGQILALVNSTSTIGSGKNKVTTTLTRFFVLTPELP